MISTEHILTAGHCVKDVKSPKYSGLTVVVETIERDSGGTNYPIKHIHIPDDYNMKIISKHNDIALITVSISLKDNKTICKYPRNNIYLIKKVINNSLVEYYSWPTLGPSLKN